MKIDFTKPHRRKDGQIGARVKVRCDGTHPQTYAFDTHGMTSTETAAKIAELDAYHTAKMAKLAEYVEGVHQQEFVVAGVTYRVVDCTIFDAGVELYMDVRAIGAAGEMTPVQGFPIRRKYRDILLLPSVAIILNEIRASLPVGDNAVESAHDEFVRKVQAKVKESGNGVPR